MYQCNIIFYDIFFLFYHNLFVLLMNPIIKMSYHVYKWQHQSYDTLKIILLNEHLITKKKKSK